MQFDINKYEVKLICENGTYDATSSIIEKENELNLYLTANEAKPEFIEIHWDAPNDDNIFVLGDAWERSYGELGFRALSDNDRYMPWYFIATDKKTSFCFGVKTGTNSFVSFRYTKNGITALVDVRNGGSGVHLEGRRLLAATFIYEEYDNAEIHTALHDFCKKMCPSPRLPKEKIYGGNNWYYAYGDSCYEQIISDARLQAELARGIDNPPFEVVDDCWSVNDTEGPWYPNEKFGDMKKLASEIKEMGVRPGIWLRPLHNKDEAITPEMRILREDERLYLDPTHPDVQTYLRDDIRRIREWGYELIKHDFSTVDLFGDYGAHLTATITNIKNWHFYDKTKTNAEIVLDFYKLLREEAGEMLIIGCNTVSHLGAGLFEISRTGDDTSAREWERTPKMGVNTLAFRIPQNEAFYMVDADCVGILNDLTPWEKNRQWLQLLSYSNSPLFVSCTDEIPENCKEDLRTAYRIFNEEKPHEFEPLGIYEERIPTKWKIDGKIVEYDWK